MKRLFVKAAHFGFVGLAGTLCALLLLEAGLRGWGAFGRFSRSRKNHQAALSSESFRIMCLGESTTVNQYPRFLESEIKTFLPDANVSVIDKGLTAVNSSVILSRLESFLDEYKPDLVVCMMGCNDANELLDYGNVRSPRVLAWMRRCRVFALFRLLWWNLLTVNDAATDNDVLGGSGGAGVRKDADVKTLSERGRELEAVVARDLTNINALLELARIKEKLGFPGQAYDLYLSVYTLDPADPRSYFHLAFCGEGKENMGKWVDAMLERRDDPRFDLLDAVEILLFTRRFDRARELLEGSTVKSPGIYMKLGQIALLEGNYREAAVCFENALKIRPKNSFARRAMELARSLVPGNDSASSSAYVSSQLKRNYNALASILERRGVGLVVVQYPMLDVRPLQEMLEGRENIVFVDNSLSFRSAVLEDGYASVFIDNFGGCFGHCTDGGNRLLARNIARQIVIRVFGVDVSESSKAAGV